MAVWWRNSPCSGGLPLISSIPNVGIWICTLATTCAIDVIIQSKYLNPTIYYNLNMNIGYSCGFSSVKVIFGQASSGLWKKLSHLVSCKNKIKTLQTPRNQWEPTKYEEIVDMNKNIIIFERVIGESCLPPPSPPVCCQVEAEHNVIWDERTYSIVKR